MMFGGSCRTSWASACGCSGRICNSVKADLHEQELVEQHLRLAHAQGRLLRLARRRHHHRPADAHPQAVSTLSCRHLCTSSRYGVPSLTMSFPASKRLTSPSPRSTSATRSTLHSQPTARSPTRPRAHSPFPPLHAPRSAPSLNPASPDLLLRTRTRTLTPTPPLQSCSASVSASARHAPSSPASPIPACATATDDARRPSPVHVPSADAPAELSPPLPPPHAPSPCPHHHSRARTRTRSCTLGGTRITARAVDVVAVRGARHGVGECRG